VQSAWLIFIVPDFGVVVVCANAGMAKASAAVAATLATILIVHSLAFRFLFHAVLYWVTLSFREREMKSRR
jgi:hypothetical protein